jgi:hypothetical protein
LPACGGCRGGARWCAFALTKRRLLRPPCRPWEHAGLMVVGAYVGHQLSLLHDSEEEKLKERLMVQRLRNEGLLPLPQGSSE